MITAKYKIWKCVLSFGEYLNGRTYIELTEEGTGELVTEGTVNIPEIEIPVDHIAVPEYRSPGITKTLASAGVIDPVPAFVVPYNFVKIPVHKLLVSPVNQ